jgi:type IV secretion system protein VirD4
MTAIPSERLSPRNGCAYTPAQLAPPRGLLLGWDQPPAEPATDSALPLVYTGDGSLLTIGSTGSGKGRGALIPALLSYPGPVIAIDVKAELFPVTARRRRELGQDVISLDPCGLTPGCGGLNPLDLLTLPGANNETDAQMLAEMLAAGHHSSYDPFWHHTATSLIAGLIAHIATTYPPDKRHLGYLRAWLYHPHMDDALAQAMKADQVKSYFAIDQFAAYLAAPAERTRPCIRATACSFVNALCSDPVEAAMNASTFRLMDVYEGKPLTIYIIIPPDKLEALRSLLCLWVGTLLVTVSRRPQIPRQRTLFLLDECGQLGADFTALRQAITLLRGSGLQVWSFWQDLSQLRRLYPDDWQTIISNCGVLQLFGIHNHLTARDWGELLGKPPAELLRLAPEQALVSLPGQGAGTYRRPDYLADPMFAGLFDPNPRFALVAPPERPGRR